jgi:hypothetical protein
VNPAHLDHRALADLAEGLLDDDHAASANAHLDDCAECRERSAEVADVSRILADIPVPPMPADLAARIPSFNGDLRGFYGRLAAAVDEDDRLRVADTGSSTPALATVTLPHFEV